MVKRLEDYWADRNPVALTLYPLSLLYCGLALLNRLRLEWRARMRPRLPVRAVVVVGNVTVGGTGKTPMVVWLCNWLREHGYRPGVVSRGYGGRSRTWPREVTPRSDPAQVGDEPVLIATRGGCPVCVGPDRNRAAHLLLAQHDCDVIVTDDGLQHYALRRDLEIVMVDGERRFGNGFCLPAGPLREPLERVREADYVVVTGGEAQSGEYAMRLVSQVAMSVRDPGRTRPLSDFVGQRVHAMAGIGHPPRFFAMLRERGLEVVEHAFPDHHVYGNCDIRFGDGSPVLMTEKDAVKCRGIAGPEHWFVPVSAVPDQALALAILRSVQAVDRIHSMR
ncbi:tetraacyldisaccharide 4'-kinase [Ectothiorhodospira haloalkaliphila]|uniref:Tetraacyldisaccharide 4'-kinase n=1 Tax=Ectothiorhodospira haloalkaliphila TaxID=421628 RepID=W8KGG5_9GAMM|nr:tetraacyldisaccharide 4'-kinase [Ectothiorhodospira haloalkaliphila]